MHPHRYRTSTVAVVIAVMLIAAGCGTNQPAGEQAAPPAAEGPAQPAPEAGSQPAPAPTQSFTPRAEAPRAQRQTKARPPAGAPSGVAPSNVAPGAAAPAKPRTVTLEEGTVLAVRTTSTLSTKTHQTGQEFEATLEKPVVVEGREILRKGAAVSGRIVEADPGGRVKGVASIALALRSVTSGGEAIAVSTNTVSRQAQSSKKKDAAKVGIGAGIGAAIGAIAGGGRGAAIGAGAGGGAGTAAVLATRGDAAVVPAETVLNFQLSGPVTVRIQP